MGIFATFATLLFLGILSPACSSSCGISSVNAQYGGSTSIKSPNYPFNYPSSATCTWTITAPYGYRVQLKFISFNTYGSGSCGSYSHYLDVYDSSYISASRRLARICGSILPPTLVTNGRYMHLTFSANYFGSPKSGFSLTVTAVNKVGCESLSLTASTSTNKTILSPNYPYKYPASTSCKWSITAPIGYVVQLIFTTFNTYSSNINGICSSSDHTLSIYDASYASYSKVLGKYCGNYLPANVVSRGTNMFLQFSSGSYSAKTGFKIQYKAIKEQADNLTICSPFNSDYTNNNIQLKASSSYKYIQSPYYPHKYPSNIKCTWIISASSSSKRIQITVTKVKIYNYYSYYCSSKDSLTIRDGASSYSTELKQFCSSEWSSSTVTSKGQKLWVQFKTDSNNYFSTATEAGFKAKFIEVEDSSNKVGLIVGVIIGIAIFIGLIVCCVYVSKRKGSPGHVRSNAGVTSVQATTTTTTNYPPPVPAPQYPLQPVVPGNYPPPGSVYQPPGVSYPPPGGNYPPTGVFPPPTGGFQPPAMAYPPAGTSHQPQAQGSYPPPSQPSANIPDDPPPQYPGPPAYPVQGIAPYNPQIQINPPPQGQVNQAVVAYPPAQDNKASAPPMC